MTIAIQHYRSYPKDSVSFEASAQPFFAERYRSQQLMNERKAQKSVYFPSNTTLSFLYRSCIGVSLISLHFFLSEV